MRLDPKRAEENFKADRAKIRTTVRMRIGIVAGIVIIGIFQTNFDTQPPAQALLPLFGVAAVGLFVVFALAYRDKKRAQDVYVSGRFHVPTRKTNS